MIRHRRHTIAFSDLSAASLSVAGGKNASLGELIKALGEGGMKVPLGFATTVESYWDYLSNTGVEDTIGVSLKKMRSGSIDAADCAAAIRKAFAKHDLPADMKEAIAAEYRNLGDVSVAVRSSATTEDSADSSFAGQHDSYLNVRGAEAVIDACRRCFASLYTERAIAYREARGIDQTGVAMSVGVQHMVRSDIGASGVMFTMDTETGFPDLVMISGAWGLGEGIVQGRVDPDEYMVFKPLLDERDGFRPIIEKSLGKKQEKCVYGSGDGDSIQYVETQDKERDRFVLSESEILQLARWGVAIEKHYGFPVDVEWAKDGATGEIFIVQARPITTAQGRSESSFKTYSLQHAGESLLSGLAIGNSIAVGPVCCLDRLEDAARFADGCVLVTDMTDPDWVPLMRRASAVVTNHGGRTSHASIVSRELGIPAITGTGRATQVLKNGRIVTVSCAEGEVGRIYAGRSDFTVDEIDLDRIPATQTKVMLNVGNPGEALRWWRLPTDGIGLARVEFIISSMVKCHPTALVRYASLTDRAVRAAIRRETRGYRDKTDYYVSTLSRGIARIAASVYPKPVIVRMSDFKSNEYADLIGGRQFEPQEENPMLGWRGASRYCHADFRDAFGLECRAIRAVREEMGFSNIVVMIPFCRTPEEADDVVSALEDNGVIGGDNGAKVYMMCEVPSNVVQLERFAARFDGFSIGSNDLTQLVLGVDRDCERLASVFDERDKSVLSLIEDIIRRAHECGRTVSLCGQGPSDHPEFAQMLVSSEIDAMSVTPDSFIRVKQAVADSERTLTVSKKVDGQSVVFVPLRDKDLRERPINAKMAEGGVP